MNKEKYLKEIEKRLDDLTKDQKQKEIFRISNELDSGKIVNDVSTEVNEIHKKYKKNKFVSKLNSLSSVFNKFIEIIKKNSVKENAIILRDFVILILIISFLKIPFLALENIFFSLLKNILSNVWLNIINLSIEVLYIVFAIIMFIKIFKKKFLNQLDKK